MIYLTRAPAAPLSDLVEFFWFYENLETDHAKEKLLPDASMELIIDLREGPKKLYDNCDLERYCTYNRCWVSGMQRQFIVMGVESGSSMMGVHFRTGGAAPFFGFPLSELSGNVVELDLIWKREILALREQLLETPTAGGKFDLLESYLLTKAQARFEPDSAVSAALRTLRSWPMLSSRELAAQLGLSHKQMLGRFDCRVGLTPKLTSRIFRFQRVLSKTNGAKTTPDWPDLAVECGFYDQAHLIHEFQQLAGLTPSEYLRSRTDFPLYVAVE